MNTRASRAGRLLVLVLATCCLPAQAIKLTVTPFGTECVVESAGEGEHVTGSFVGTLVGGKRHDAFVYRTFFDLEVTTEEGTGLFTTRNRQDSKFDFIMPKAGRFLACIHNRGRHPTEVSLHTTVGWREKHDKLTADHLTPLRSDVSRLLGQLRLMAEEQTYLEARDRMLKATNESTATRAVMWALVEAAVLLTVSVAQVVAVKSFFSEKTSSGGVIAGLTSGISVFGKSGSFGKNRGHSKGLLGV